jgi:hypothetical protein
MLLGSQDGIRFDPSSAWTFDGPGLRHCDERLKKYRAALDEGIEPSVVGAWIAEVQAERQRAEDSLARMNGTQRMTRTQINELIEQLTRADHDARAR